MSDRRNFLKTSILGSAGLCFLNNVLKAEKLSGLQDFIKPADFSWGVTIAAAQNEGAYNVDGRGLSIWDSFAQRNRKIKDKSNPELACDFYNRYKEDIDLVKALGFDSFRFSIAWSRILPDGKSTVNNKGIDFYNRLIDYCLEIGIRPWVMLYHWDLPQALEDKGGWVNRDICRWFEDYTFLCSKSFGDRAKDWLVLNEPLGFTSLGYLLGHHAPGRYGMKNFIPAMHHAVLCQAIAGRVLREQVSNANIGTTFSCTPITPLSDSDRHINASKRLDAFFNRLFIEPSLGLGYPVNELSFLSKLEKYWQPDDEKLMAFNFDFIGLQNYFRMIGKFGLVPYLWASRDKDFEDNTVMTSMDWEVYPEGIYQIIAQFSKYPVNQILITENGAAFVDQIENGSIHDKQRVEFFKSYIGQVIKAKQDFGKVSGYFAWTLTDNWEWAEGFRPKFGLVHVDFDTQKRTIKDSGLWFRKMLKSM